MTARHPRSPRMTAGAPVVHDPRASGAAPRHPAVARRLERATPTTPWPRLTFWVIAALTVIGLGVRARPAQAQRSVAPMLAIGAAVPADAGDDLSEGFTAKAGLWIRSPDRPFGVTIEGLYARLGGDGTSSANRGLHLGGATVNLTTKRHESRFDTYVFGGAGYYWYSNRGGRLRSNNGPGFNAGIGEVLSIGRRDLFVELRYHRIRVDDPGADRWMSFIPMVVGARF